LPIPVGGRAGGNAPNVLSGVSDVRIGRTQIIQDSVAVERFRLVERG